MVNVKTAVDCKTITAKGGRFRATVLIGFAEALAAPEVVWSLVDGGFNVVAFGRRGRLSALRHSRHVVIHDICPPELDLKAAESDLQSLIASLSGEKQCGQRVLFPLDDTAVWLCNQVPLPPEWLLAGPQGANAKLALNKHVQTQQALNAGFNVPEALFTRTTEEVFSACNAKSFPVILRPVECVPRSQNRVCKCRKWICANQAELERAVRDWAGAVPLLVQPFICGIGEGIFGLATPDGIRAWSAHKRVRMMNPQGSGSSACVSQPVPEDLKLKVERLIKESGWSGLFMIESLRDASGTAWFVELNGRPWGSMALSRSQGLEYPAWQVELAIEQQSQVGLTTLTAPGMVCKHVGREIMHLLFVLRGPKSKALTNWPSIWKAIGDVLRVHRGDTIYNWRREDPTVFLADCYYTVRENLLKPRS